jgi:hypothetical protein
MLRIEDLPESRKLDREAMQRLFGGRTSPVSASPLLSTSTRSTTFSYYALGGADSSNTDRDPTSGNPAIDLEFDFSP